MKSPMVTNLDIPNKAGYTDLQVCQSAAGYYVGTLYWDDEYKFFEPGSRDSDYYATYEEAERFLKTLDIVGQGTAAMVLRETP